MSNIEPASDNTNQTNTNQMDIPWNKDDDKILKEWVDKSACFKLLHEKAYKKYKKSYLRQMIPVIVISTLTGAANFALDKISNETQRSYASLVVGSFNILAAMISTVSQFLKTSELKEGHNIAAKSWDKFNRSLKLELQRHPNERANKRELFNFSMKEFDRLVEISPDIPNTVIEQFRNIYKDAIDLIKPEITGHIISSRVYEIENKPEALVIIDNNNEFDEELNKRNIYVEKFKNKYNRVPTSDEINEYLELSTFSSA